MGELFRARGCLQWAKSPRQSPAWLIIIQPGDAPGAASALSGASATDPHRRCYLVLHSHKSVQLMDPAPWILPLEQPGAAQPAPLWPELMADLRALTSSCLCALSHPRSRDMVLPNLPCPFQYKAPQGHALVGSPCRAETHVHPLLQVPLRSY
jgi:hypothetical protein